MNVFLLVFLFNVQTGVLGDPTIVADLKTPKKCIEAAISKGPQSPDKDGNVKIYDCGVPPDRPDAKITEL